jgi:hypothetical protein
VVLLRCSVLEGLGEMNGFCGRVVICRFKHTDGSGGEALLRCIVLHCYVSSRLQEMERGGLHGE